MSERSEYAIVNQLLSGGGQELNSLLSELARRVIAGGMTINSSGYLTFSGASFGNAINVLQKGAYTDGLTDSASAFQAAHDALPSAGGVIYVPAISNPYLIGSNVVTTKPVWWIGDGWATRIRATGSTMTAILEFQSGAQGSIVSNMRIEGNKTGVGGNILRGVYFNGAKDCVIAFCLLSGPTAVSGLNFGVDINGVLSGRSKVLWNRFERLCSSSGNGTSILIELSNLNLIGWNDLDGSEFNNFDSGPGAAIFLSAASSGGVGSVDNRLIGNYIKSHPQVAIDVNSTTYAQFSGRLGGCDNNVIEDNDIYLCGASAGGDAGAGIALISNSSFNRIRRNRIHVCNGPAVVLAGSQGVAKTITDASHPATPIIITANGHGFNNGDQVWITEVLGNTNANGLRKVKNKTVNTFEITNTSDVNIASNAAYTGGGLVGVEGTAKIDETPNYNQIVDNYFDTNLEQGINNKGAANTIIEDNKCYENGSRTSNTYPDIELATVGGAATGSNCVVRKNYCVGANEKYRLKIGASVDSTTAWFNHFPAAGTAPYLNSGTNSSINMNSGLDTLRCSAYHSTTASIGTGAWTVLSLDSEDWDLGAFHSTSVNTSRLTVPVGGAGSYLIRGKLRFAAAAGGTLRGISIYKNGSAIKYHSHPVNNPVTADFEIASVEVLAAGDYIELACYQDTGGNLNAGDVTRQLATELQIERVGG